MNLQCTVPVSGLSLQVNFVGGCASIFHLNYPPLTGELVFLGSVPNNISKGNDKLIIGLSPFVLKTSLHLSPPSQFRL